MLYNWWVAVPFISGLMPSPNQFFSNLEVDDLRDASLFQHLDFITGTLMVLALLIRGPRGTDGSVRREWRWCVLFSLCGLLGGIFAFSCPEGSTAVCRNLEWHLHLPLHHYLHAAVGIVEFAAATTGIWLGSHSSGSPRRQRAFHTLFVILCVGYPLLGVAYLTNRLGALIEPVFFLSFAVMILLELEEPAGPRVDAESTKHHS